MSVRRGAAPSFPLSLTTVRERSAGMALLRSLAPRRRRPRALRARRLPALHCGVFHPGTVSSGPTGGLSSPVIRAAFAALHPDRTGLLSKAALRSKGEREPEATRTSCVRAQGRGRHTCSAIKTPHDGALTRAGMPSVQGLTSGSRLIGIPVFVRWGRSVRSLGMEAKIPMNARACQQCCQESCQ